MSSVPEGHHRQDDEESGWRRRPRCECGWTGGWVRTATLAYLQWHDHLKQVRSQ